ARRRRLARDGKPRSDRWGGTCRPPPCAVARARRSAPCRNDAFIIGGASRRAVAKTQSGRWTVNGGRGEKMSFRRPLSTVHRPLTQASCNQASRRRHAAASRRLQTPTRRGGRDELAAGCSRLGTEV